MTNPNGPIYWGTQMRSKARALCPCSLDLSRRTQQPLLQGETFMLSVCNMGLIVQIVKKQWFPGLTIWDCGDNVWTPCYFLGCSPGFSFHPRCVSILELFLLILYFHTSCNPILITKCYDILRILTTYVIYHISTIFLIITYYPLVISHSHGQWPIEIDGCLPIKHGWIFPWLC